MEIEKDSLHTKNEVYLAKLAVDSAKKLFSLTPYFLQLGCRVR